LVLSLAPASAGSKEILESAEQKTSGGEYRCYLEPQGICLGGDPVGDVGRVVLLYGNHDYFLVCRDTTVAEIEQFLVNSGQFSTGVKIEVYCSPRTGTGFLPTGTQLTVRGKYIGK
jgi:hypothetical protein